MKLRDQTFILVMVLGACLPLISSIPAVNSLWGGPARDYSLNWLRYADAGLQAHLRKIHRSKIVLVGGSNVMFGFDETQIEDSIHMPVVAFGLHAGLGADLIAERVMPHIAKGDVIVLLPEWYQFNRIENPTLVRLEWFEEHGSEQGLNQSSTASLILGRSMFESKTIVDLVNGKLGAYTNRLHKIQTKWARHWARKKGLPWPPRQAEAAPQVSSPPALPASGPASPYMVESFDQFGRQTFRRPQSKMTGMKSFFDTPRRFDLHHSPAAIAFELLRRRCQEVGASFFISGPVRLSPNYPDQILPFEKRLVEWSRRKGVPLLIDPADLVFDPALGFDTAYHLNDRGMRLASERMVSALRANAAVDSRR
jgi:hypothetical protein